MVRKHNPNCLEIGLRGSSFLSKPAVLIIVLQNEHELCPMFADTARRHPWPGSSGNLQAVGPRAHESRSSMCTLTEVKKCWLDKEIINKICNTNKPGGNSRRVKMANEPCESIFV